MRYSVGIGVYIGVLHLHAMGDGTGVRSARRLLSAVSVPNKDKSKYNDCIELTSMFVCGWDGRIVCCSRDVDILSHAFDEI